MIAVKFYEIVEIFNWQLTRLQIQFVWQGCGEGDIIVGHASMVNAAASQIMTAFRIV